MPSVNRYAETTPDHVAYLLHRVTRRMRELGEDRHDPDAGRLRAAQARLLDLIPDDGGRVSDLAREMRTSKQGLGQLALQLAALGYVEMTPDPLDRRAKRVRRTAAGSRERQAVRDTLAAVEDVWRAAVGAERYAVFRVVLEELGSAEHSATGQDAQV